MSFFNRLTQRFTSSPVPVAEINHVYCGTAELIERFKAKYDPANKFHYIVITTQRTFDDRLGFAPKDWITLTGATAITVLGSDKANVAEQLAQVKAVAGTRCGTKLTEFVVATPTWQAATVSATKQPQLALAAARMFTHSARERVAEVAPAALNQPSLAI